MEKRELRKKARALDPIAAVGKQGITEGVISQIKAELARRKLIKVQIRKSAHPPGQDARRLLAERLAESAGAQVVDQIGSMVVLYKR